jgi:hypothetical protein
MRRGKSLKTGNTRHYTVGYAKPPTASRFKPGQSGNAKGRPKGRKNFKTLIRNAMTAKISIQEGGRNRQVSKLEGWCCVRSKVRFRVTIGQPWRL